MPRKPLDGCKAARPPVHHPPRTWTLDSQLHIPTAWVSPLSLRPLLIRSPPWNQWMLLHFGPTPAHEEASNFRLTGSQWTIVGMVEPKIDDRAYFHDQFYRHGVFKSGSSCLRSTPDYGYFRRHDDVLKRLPCLQLKFQSFLGAGTIADFSSQHACTRKFHTTSDRHDDGFQHPACLCCSFLRIQNICFSLFMQERSFAIIYLVLPYSVGGWSF